MPTIVTPLSGPAGASGRLRFVGLGTEADLPFFLIAMDVVTYFLLLLAFTKYKVNFTATRRIS